MKQYHIVCLVLALSLTACQTPYQGMGFGGGVSASVIDGTHARISAKGNGFTDSATIQEYALLKAAEVTTAANKHYFKIVNASDTTRHTSYTTPTQSYTTTTGTVNANTYGNNVYGSYQGNTSTTTYGGQTTNFVKPGTDVIIRMFFEGEVDAKQPGVFDAAAIMQNLGAKYIKQD